MLEIRDGGDLWQWSQLEIRLNAFHQPTVPQKQFIIIIIIIFEKDGVFSKFMISFYLKSMPYVDIFYKWPMKTVMANKWQWDSNPGNSACYFFDITGHFISSTLPVLFFSGITHYQQHNSATLTNSAISWTQTGRQLLWRIVKQSGKSANQVMSPILANSSN